MKKTFINFSNHSSGSWHESQIKAAEKYGDIIDLPFPVVDPDSSKEEVSQIGEVCYKKIMGYNPSAVLCQGEFTLTVNVIRRLMESNVTVVAACSKRIVKEEGSVRTSVFEFVRFREYV